MDYDAPFRGGRFAAIRHRRSWFNAIALGRSKIAAIHTVVGLVEMSGAPDPIRQLKKRARHFRRARFSISYALLREVLVATSAAAATTTTTAIAATSTAAVALARSACGEVFARTRLVDGEIATVEIFSVELRDRRLCLSIAGHGDEAEAAGVSGHFILHECSLRDAARAGEEILKIVLSGVEGKVPDV